MQSTLCDGLPVSYSPSDSTTDDPLRACTTQSPAHSGNYSSLEGFYTPSPSLDTAETAQPAPQQTSQFLTDITTAAQTYSLPAISSTGSSQGIWPTPPATACDDLEEYTYRASATSAAYGMHGAAPSSISSIDSPGTWSSPEAQQLTYQQAICMSQESTPPYSMQIVPTMPTEDHFHQRMLTSSPMANHAFLTHTMEQDPTITDPPVRTPGHAGAITSDHGVSPGAHDDLYNSHAFTGGLVGLPNGQEVNGSDGDDANRADQPYAQLICNAFMSRERHAMTLQELYQWFRENTDKTKTDNKGWQNSIRHNLSMNAAFVRRDKKPAPGDTVTDSDDTKKPSEWVLEDWAVKDGVQSTTRYRKTTPSRRGGSASHRSQHNHPMTARASSGRKGGIKASKTRSAAQRATLQRQHQYGGMMASQVPFNDLPKDHTFYHQHPSMDFANPGRGEPVTPPEIHAGDMLFGDTMHGQQGLVSGLGQGYYYGHEPPQPQHRHLHQPHPHPYPNANVYRLEDATGVYEPPPTCQSAGPSDPSQLPSHLPPAFSNDIFTNGMEEGEASTSAHGSNLHYSWGDGSQYQS
ncbi:hypothetical protein SUNI508_00887 [Seiridium unicorne]|uniref:Fork-head domain-containing protein n=1 Tax=Seiridium unicorne TaxID=138068 RepID=A0ABR2V1R6_9PEZI